MIVVPYVNYITQVALLRGALELVADWQHLRTFDAFRHVYSLMGVDIPGADVVAQYQTYEGYVNRQAGAS